MKTISKQRKPHETKTCAVFYSGGKDGHLALTEAIRRKYTVACLIHMDGGNKHHKYFNELRKAHLVRIHGRLLGIPVFIWPTPRTFSPQKMHDFLPRLLRAARDRYSFEKVFCGSLSSDEGGTAAEFRKTGRDIGTEIITPCEDYTLVSGTNAMLKRGITALIVGADKEAGLEWVGRILDKKFLAHAATLRARGAGIDANFVQTTVIASPLFSGFVNVSATRFKAGGRGGFLQYKAALDRGTLKIQPPPPKRQAPARRV